MKIIWSDLEPLFITVLGVSDERQSTIEIIVQSKELYSHFVWQWKNLTRLGLQLKFEVLHPLQHFWVISMSPQTNSSQVTDHETFFQSQHWHRNQCYSIATVFDLSSYCFFIQHPVWHNRIAGLLFLFDKLDN